MSPLERIGLLAIIEHGAFFVALATIARWGRALIIGWLSGRSSGPWDR